MTDAGRLDLDQPALKHRSSGRGQFRLALLRTRLPGSQEQAVGNLRASAEMDPEFLPQPGTLGGGEGRRRGSLDGWAHTRKKGGPAATRKRLRRYERLCPALALHSHLARKH